MSDYRADFAALSWDRPAPGVRVKTIVRDNATLRLVQFTDEFVETKWCLNGHVGYVVDGEMEVEFTGGVIRFTAGDGLLIPAGETHRHRHFSTKHRVTLFLVENV